MARPTFAENERVGRIQLYMNGLTIQYMAVLEPGSKRSVPLLSIYNNLNTDLVKRLAKGLQIIASAAYDVAQDPVYLPSKFVFAYAAATIILDNAYAYYWNTGRCEENRVAAEEVKCAIDTIEAVLFEPDLPPALLRYAVPIEELRVGDYRAIQFHNPDKYRPDHLCIFDF